MTATPAEIRKQTAEINAFLRAACPVCLIEHDEAIHAATLRLREPAPNFDRTPRGPNLGVAKFRDCPGDLPSARAVVLQCQRCGADYATLSPRISKHCQPCGDERNRELSKQSGIKYRAKKKRKA